MATRYDLLNLKMNIAPEFVIKMIDPLLIFKKEFETSSTIVCQVELGNNLYILKIADPSHFYGVKHLKNEARVLELARGVRGITQLVKRYLDSEEYKSPLLKEFFEGETVRASSRISEIHLQRQLEEAVHDLHSLDIADLDLKGENVVVSYDRQKVKIIDLDYAKFYGLIRKFISYSEFQRLKEDDLRDLEGHLFS